MCSIMTFGLLRAYDLPIDQSLIRELVSDVIDFFYDHKTNSHGFVFKESDLDFFVQRYGSDPFSMGNAEENTPLINYASISDFVEKIRSGEYISVSSPHRDDQHPTVTANYTRHAVYKSK